MIDFKRFRKDKRLTQAALANMLGMDQSRISRMEKNGDGFTPEHMDILCSRYADIDDYVIDDSNVAPAPTVSALLALVASQQRTIENLSETIKNLTSKNL